MLFFKDTSRAGDKYETTSTVNGYMKFMKLKIRNVGANDFGTYRCVAKNSLGETDGNIKLDGKSNTILNRLQLPKKNISYNFNLFHLITIFFLFYIFFMQILTI